MPCHLLTPVNAQTALLFPLMMSITTATAAHFNLDQLHSNQCDAYQGLFTSLLQMVACNRLVFHVGPQCTVLYNLWVPSKFNSACDFPFRDFLSETPDSLMHN